MAQKRKSKINGIARMLADLINYPAVVAHVTSLQDGDTFKQIASFVRAYEIEDEVRVLLVFASEAEIMGEKSAQVNFRELTVESIRRDDFEWLIRTPTREFRLSAPMPALAEDEADAVETMKRIPRAIARAHTVVSDTIRLNDGTELTA